MANENNVLAGISSARELIIEAINGIEIPEVDLGPVNNNIESAKSDILQAIDNISEQGLQPALDAISDAQDH